MKSAPFSLAHYSMVGIAAFAAAGVAQVAAAQSAPNYRVVRTVALGAPDRWDYVVFDAASHRVYVAHGDRVTVVDGRDGTIVGQVEGFSGGTHGVAIAAAAGHGYTDDGRMGTAGSFDLKTLKVVHTVTAQEDADALAFDPKSGHVFVVNGDPGTLTVIDPKTDMAIATVNVGGKLEYAVADGRGALYINGNEKNEIVRVDTASNQVEARWPMSTCKAPTGLAIDAQSRRLFSSCRNGVMVVVDATNGHIVTTLPIGRGTDAAAFDPKRHLAFSSNGMDGTISIIEEKDANTFVSAGTVKTAMSARTMAVDPESGRLYLAAADIDPNAPALPPPGDAPPGPPPAGVANAPPGPGGPGGPPRRMPFLPGSLKLLFLDPAP
jgi:YVTN family beta-propeller protein